MRFLIRLKARMVPERALLDAVRTIGRTLGADPRNPKWTSYGALELDIFATRREDFDLFMAAVEPVAQVEFTKDLNVAPPFKDEAEVYEEAKTLFDAERYWECHEVLEGVWRTKQGEVKRLLQGIILVCAAFVHYQKGENGVAMGVLKRSESLLAYRSPRFGPFDLEHLRANVNAILASGKFELFSI